MTDTPQPQHRRTLAEALRDGVLAWSPRAYEARLVFTAVVAGLLARWVHLSALWAIISAVLVLQPDPVATRRNSLVRFAATGSVPRPAWVPSPSGSREPGPFSSRWP